MSLTAMCGLRILVVLSLAFGGGGSAPAAKKKPFRDSFKTANHGVMKGWLVEHPWPDQDNASQNWRTIPGRLVLSRHGHVIRSLRAPSFWHWDFWADGNEVVFEAGPLHGDTSCARQDIRSGSVLETWPGDCRAIPDDAPAWVKAAAGTL